MNIKTNLTLALCLSSILGASSASSYKEDFSSDYDLPKDVQSIKS